MVWQAGPDLDSYISANYDDEKNLLFEGVLLAMPEALLRAKVASAPRRMVDFVCDLPIENIRAVAAMYLARSEVAGALEPTVRVVYLHRLFRRLGFDEEDLVTSGRLQIIMSGSGPELYRILASMQVVGFQEL
jgi:hypothetical protein